MELIKKEVIYFDVIRPIHSEYKTFKTITFPVEIHQSGVNNTDNSVTLVLEYSIMAMINNMKNLVQFRQCQSYKWDLIKDYKPDKEKIKTLVYNAFSEFIGDFMNKIQHTELADIQKYLGDFIMDMRGDLLQEQIDDLLNGVKSALN